MVYYRKKNVPFYMFFLPTLKEMNIPQIDWEESGEVPDPHIGVNVPQLGSPLTPEQLAALQHHIHPLQPSESNGIDVYMTTVQYVEGLLQER